MTTLFEPLTLPNGAVISNRLCKAAMEENMAEPGQVPGQALINLYTKWAAGGPGIILTGNVMVAPDAMTGHVLCTPVWHSAHNDSVHPGVVCARACGQRMRHTQVPVASGVCD